MGGTRLEFIKTISLAFGGLMVNQVIRKYSPEIQSVLPDLLTGKNGQPVNTLEGWNDIRISIKERWSAYLGILPADPSPPAVRVLKEEHLKDLVRQYVEYENEPGKRICAYIIKPVHVTDALPAVVAMHSTSDNKMHYIAGVEKGAIPPSALSLAEKRFVVICPQCYLWRNKGDRTYEEQAARFQQDHKGSKGMAGMLYDAMRAVDVLLAMPEVDNARIGAMGHSLGGKEALYLGAFDDRVKVIVSNEGGIGIDFSNWDDRWYLGREIQSFGHQHHEILALCAPKPFLLIGGDSADGERSIPYINAVKPVYELYGKPGNIEFFDHGKGHDIVPESDAATFAWLIRHLSQT
jgi:hypothetical protein